MFKYNSTKKYSMAVGRVWWISGWLFTLSLKSVQSRNVIRLGGGGGQEVLMVETVGARKSAQGKLVGYLAEGQEKADQEGHAIGDRIRGSRIRWAVRCIF